jgi:hypothetical protein
MYVLKYTPHCTAFFRRHTNIHHFWDAKQNAHNFLSWCKLLLYSFGQNWKGSGNFFLWILQYQFSWKKFGGSEILKRVQTNDKSDFLYALRRNSDTSKNQRDNVGLYFVKTTARPLAIMKVQHGNLTLRDQVDCSQSQLSQNNAVQARWSRSRASAGSQHTFDRIPILLPAHASEYNTTWNCTKVTHSIQKHD